MNDFATRPAPSVAVRRIGQEQRSLVVVDGLLAEPEAMVDYAATEVRFAPLRAAANFYPGLRAAAPQPYVAALFGALRETLREVFRAPVDGSLRLTCALSLTTLSPERLNLAQRLPHVDTVEPGQLAILHYLGDPRHGGTGFFRHRSTGFETLDRERAPAYFAALEREVAEHPPEPDYVRGSTPLFEQTEAVEARFNRVVVYESQLLHSGLIDPASGLTDDPRTGRLTANAFLSWDAAA